MSTPSEISGETSEAALPFIPLSEPCLQGNEWNYVRECLDTGWVSSAGKFVDRFEGEVAQYTQASHAVATVNGTSALHAALLAVGVEPDDEVLVSTLTFIASVNAIRYIGAHPILIDAEPDYWQMDPQLVADFLASQCHMQNGVLRNRSTGRRVRAIMPVHVLGHPVALNDLLNTARQYELSVVEDAAESLGTKYRGQKLGTFGDVTCFSFNGNKTITAGAGGVIVTNKPEIADRARYLTTQAKDDPVEYEHHAVGYNYRMSNVLAAIGLAQLESIDSVIDVKRQIARRYQTDLACEGLTWYQESRDAFSTCWLSTVLMNPSACGMSAVELRQRLHDCGIQTRRLWRPMHTNRPYMQCQKVLTGVADRIADNALSFPSSASLTPADQQRVCRTALALLTEADTDSATHAA